MFTIEKECTGKVATATLGESMAVAIAFFYTHPEITTASYTDALISEVIAMPIQKLGTIGRRRTVMIVSTFGPPSPCSRPAQMELRQNVDLAGQPSGPWEVVRVVGSKRLPNGGMGPHAWKIS